MIDRRAFWTGLLSLLSTPALAKRFKGGVGTGTPTQATISDIALSSTIFPESAAAGTDIGTVTVPLSTGTFGGTLAVNDTTNFQVAGSAPSFTLQNKITVAAGQYPITLTATEGGLANSPFPKNFTITSTPVTGEVIATQTVANTSGSASPNPTPVTRQLWFPKGLIPTGSYVEPNVGGSPLATWQCDSRVYWPDGSLMGGTFRMLVGSVTGNGTTQISYKAQAGSFSNTSAVTVATVTGETNYNLAISKMHTAQLLAPKAASLGLWQVGLTINSATGQLTGGVVHYNNNGTAISGTQNVYVNGVQNGSVSIANTVVSVVNAGSGITYLGTNGDFTAAFNTCVTDAGTNAQQPNNQLVQYAKGPVCDAWRGMMRLKDATSGAAQAHIVVVFYVERWKTAAGALLAYRATARLACGQIDTTNNLFNYTMDCDWREGSTVIRGKTNADAGYTTIPVNMASGFMTLDTNGQMDWSASDAAYKAVVQQLTSAEADYLKSTGIALPYATTFNGNAVGSNITTPTLTAAFTVGNNDLTRIPAVQPMGAAGLRNPQGTGGTAHNAHIYPDHMTLWWLAAKNGDTTAQRTWLRCVRGTAALWATAAQAGPHVETDTYYIGCPLPTTVQSFTGMNTVHNRSTFGWVDTSAIQKGYCNAINNTGQGFPVAMDPYHLPCYDLPLYIIEGEQWALDSAMWTAGTLNFYCGPTQIIGPRNNTIAGTAYYSQHHTHAQTRSAAWIMRTLLAVAKFLPTTWADGTAHVEQACLQKIVSHNYDFTDAVIGHTGTMTWGTRSVTKSDSWAGLGMWAPQVWSAVSGNTNGTGEIWNFYMEYYQAMVICYGAYLWQDTIPKLTSFRDHLMVGIVGRWSSNSAPYLSDTQYGNWFQSPSSAAAQGDPVTSWDVGNPDASGNPGIAVQQPAASGGGPTALNALVGLKMNNNNSTISVVKVASNTTAAMLYTWGSPNGPGTPTTFADGSGILLTTTGIAGFGPSLNIASIPAPFGTTYAGQRLYMRNVTAANANPQTITLHPTKADALAGTNAITPSGSTGNNAPVQFFGYPNNARPANTAGYGSYNNATTNDGQARGAQAYGALRMGKAYGATTAGLDTAITNTQNIITAIGVTFKDEPLYAHDVALG